MRKRSRHTEWYMLSREAPDLVVAMSFRVVLTTTIETQSRFVHNYH